MAVVLAPSTKRRSAFHTLTVRGVRRLTEDAVEVTLDVPPTLQDAFGYLPGQYVALRTTLDVGVQKAAEAVLRQVGPASAIVAVRR